jgi:branched-chain amino acid aminotransferase
MFRPHTFGAVRPLDIARADRMTYRRGDTTLNHKSTSYFRQHRYIGEPIVFVNERNELCETPTGNLFFLIGTSIVTPPLSAPCLPGIIRAALLKTSTVNGMPIVEADVTVTDLEGVDACVTTNSLHLATAVDSVLGIRMARSAELASEFRARLISLGAA